LNSGSGSGFLMPDSATYPFTSNGARDTWANANKQDLIKNSTVVNVSSTTWYVWRGEDNPETYDSINWADVTPIIKGEKGDQGNALDLSSIPGDTITKTNSGSTGIESSLITQPDNTGVIVDGELTTSKGTLNIGRGLSLGESGLAPIFTDVLESESSLPVLSNLNEDGTTLQPHYIKRYDLTNSVLQPLEGENVAGSWDATVPVTSTRVITKLRIKFGASATGIRLTLRYAETPSEKDGIVLYQSHTDAEFNSGVGFSVASGLFEIDLGKEAAKVISGKYVCILLEQSPLGAGQIQLLGATTDIGGVTQFYAYLEQTYVLEEAVAISSQPVNWKKVSSDYTSVSGDMYLDCRPSAENITVTINDTYPTDWSGLFIYNESKRKDVIVKNQSGDTVVIVDRKEGQAIYLDAGSFQSTTIMGRPEGISEVVNLDVSADSSITLDNTYTGKFVNIIQNGTQTAIPMIITLSDHAQFSTGDVIKIGTEKSYVNYYYAVNYNDSQGTLLVVYPSRLQGISLVRTDGGWDVSLDGTYNKVAVRPKAKAGVPFADNDPDVRPVQAFSFIDHPAVDYIEDASGNRAIEIDLNKVINVNPDTVDIVGWWSINASPDASDIANALGQVQSSAVISHTDNIKSDELPETNIAMKRDETSAKYTYFAYPTGFFTDKDGGSLEPTLVNTGVGNSADWVVSTVYVDGVTYRVQRSPAQNFSQQLLTCKLIQEGY
jgi:hypothetical protein